MTFFIKVDFRVRVLGTPRPAVQWFKDDLEIFSCERMELREEAEGLKLCDFKCVSLMMNDFPPGSLVVLKGARLSDSGIFKCIATNVLGKAVTIAQLAVEGKCKMS